jgi:hypothetical protein
VTTVDFAAVGVEGGNEGWLQPAIAPAKISANGMIFTVDICQD